MGGTRQFGDDVLGTGGMLDVGEHGHPAVGLQSSSDFMSDTGLAHAALPGQQDMIAVADPTFKDPEFGLTSVEVIPDHPPAGSGFHGASFFQPFDRTLAYNKIVDNN